MCQTDWIGWINTLLVLFRKLHCHGSFYSHIQCTTPQMIKSKRKKKLKRCNTKKYPNMECANRVDSTWNYYCTLNNLMAANRKDFLLHSVLHFGTIILRPKVLFLNTSRAWSGCRGLFNVDPSLESILRSTRLSAVIKSEGASTEY